MDQMTCDWCGTASYTCEWSRCCGEVMMCSQCWDHGICEGCLRKMERHGVIATELQEKNQKLSTRQIMSTLLNSINRVGNQADVEHFQK